MLESTLATIIDFSLALNADPRNIRLKEAEAKMISDPDVIALSQEKDRKNEVYEDFCRLFGEESEKTKQAYRDLYEVKTKLDQLPSVREYQSAYNALHMTFFEIDHLLFVPFRGKKGCAHD